MWKDVNSGIVMRSGELLCVLQSCDKQVILIEGSTNCGKSRLVREFRSISARTVEILSAEALVEYLIETTIKKGENRYTQAINSCDVLCIEDVDWALGKTIPAQLESAIFFSKIAQKALVILNGIQCTQRIPVLLEHLKDILRCFRYIPEDRDLNIQQQITFEETL